MLNLFNLLTLSRILTLSIHLLQILNHLTCNLIHIWLFSRLGSFTLRRILTSTWSLFSCLWPSLFLAAHQWWFYIQGDLWILYFRCSEIGLWGWRMSPIVTSGPRLRLNAISSSPMIFFSTSWAFASGSAKLTSHLSRLWNFLFLNYFLHLLSFRKEFSVIRSNHNIYLTIVSFVTVLHNLILSVVELGLNVVLKSLL